MVEVVQKVVLITGASSGIGEATALEFAKLGYKIAITGRNEERLNKVHEQLVANSPAKSPEDFQIIKADFEDPSQVEPIVGQTVSKFNRLDILVNNAGYTGKKKTLEHEDFFEDFQQILQVNLIAQARICQLACPHLKKTKGVIINVSSVADRLAMPNISYSVSKAGLSMLTKTLANALDGSGVRVVTLSPGPIRTRISEGMDALAGVTSLLRIGDAKEAADTIVFLASEKASFIHGCTLDIDGGMLAKFGGAFTQHKDIFE